MQRWKAAALASVLCSSVLSIWMCRDGLLLSHRLGPALAPLRRPPRTLDARIARLAQCASGEGTGAVKSVEEGGVTLRGEAEVQVDRASLTGRASSGWVSPLE
ncbi:Neurturin [Myotis davidii]|uniref:Neurturin n=1 Tax=Myotis davidii TaxID=225400 RepID=L5LUU2_MYODS|nr:Neurturin [Myotis davidii]